MGLTPEKMALTNRFLQGGMAALEKDAPRAGQNADHHRLPDEKSGGDDDRAKAGERDALEHAHQRSQRTSHLAGVRAQSSAAADLQA
jgi:hypothetical protein